MLLYKIQEQQQLYIEAVVNGTPLIEKVVTVSGKAIKNPKNVKVAIGTPFSYIFRLLWNK